MFQNRDLWVRPCEGDWVALNPTGSSVPHPFLPAPVTIPPIVPSAPNSALIHLWAPFQVHRATLPEVLWCPHPVGPQMWPHWFSKPVGVLKPIKFDQWHCSGGLDLNSHGMTPSALGARQSSLKASESISNSFQENLTYLRERKDRR